MPAIVKCPNGCKLQVPVRKLFDTFQCPKCSTSLFVAHEQIDAFQDNRKHVIQANHSSDLVEIVSDDIIFLEGQAENLLVEVTSPESGEKENQTSEPNEPEKKAVTDESSSSTEVFVDQKTPNESSTDLLPDPTKLQSNAGESDQQNEPLPPPIVDQGPSDAVFAKQKKPFVQPETPKLRPGTPQHFSDSESQSVPALPAEIADKKKLGKASTTGNKTASLAADANSHSTVRPAEKKQNDPPDATTPAEEPTSDYWLDRWFRHPENPGVLNRKEYCWRAYSLGWAMVVIGVFLLAPVIYTMLQWIGKDYHLPLGRWSFLLVFFSAIQFLYAMFLFQIPDWSSTRFVSYLMLLMTVMSTFMLAVAFLSKESNNFFNFLQLSVTNKNLVSGWLLVMSIGFGMMSYLCGRTTQQWVNDEKRLGWK